MIKLAFRLAVVAFMLVGWGLAAAALFVIRTPTTFTIVPKDRLFQLDSLKDTYVDTRNWTLEDVKQHPAVTARLLELKQTDLLAHVKDAKVGGTLEDQLRNAIANSPTAGQELQDRVLHQAVDTVTKTLSHGR